MTPEPAKRIVEAGYDAIAGRYATWQREIRGSPRDEWLAKLLAVLPQPADVLELGCGAGVRSTRVLAGRARLVGVDISGEQVRRARERVPNAEFLHADFTALDLPPASFDAVVSFYALGHVPRAELPRLYDRIGVWLRPGGFLLTTAGRRDEPDMVEADWLGAPMFFSSFDAETNLTLLRAAGLEIVEHDVVCQDEGEQGEACFLWVLARRPE